jgi:hypothetical protein
MGIDDFREYSENTESMTDSRASNNTVSTSTSTNSSSGEENSDSTSTSYQELRIDLIRFWRSSKNDEVILMMWEELFNDIDFQILLMNNGWRYQHNEV